MGTIIGNRKLKMSGFMASVRAVETGPGQLAIFWLGQAGFMFKTPAGRLVTVDPYLSDYCERAANFKRLMLSVMPPEELETDDLFMSHVHPDHYDADLIDVLKTKKMPRMFGPQSCGRLISAAGISHAFTTLAENKLVSLGEYSVLPVKADHGDLEPDAQGYIFDFGFVKVYYAGDTAYSPALLKKVYEVGADIALLPINGEYGNLNPSEAVRLAGEIGAKVLVPCHFWTFVEHGSCPLDLIKAKEQLSSNVEIVILAQGEGLLHDSSK